MCIIAMHFNHMFVFWQASTFPSRLRIAFNPSLRFQPSLVFSYYINSYLLLGGIWLAFHLPEQQEPSLLHA